MVYQIVYSVVIFSHSLLLSCPSSPNLVICLARLFSHSYLDGDRINFKTFVFLAVEVSWYIGVFARLSRWEPGFESHLRRGTFVLQRQGNLSTLLLSTQVYKWGPGRRWQIIVFEFASAVIGGYTRQGMLPGEWKLCTVSVALKSIQYDRGNKTL